SAEAIMGAIALVSLAVLVGGAWAALHLANLFADPAQELPVNPFTLVVALGLGEASWTGGASAVAAAEAVLAPGATALAVWLLRKARKARSRVDTAVRYMGSTSELETYTHRGAMATARRFGLDTPGIPLGRAVESRQELYLPWEFIAVHAWGTRT